MKHRLPILLAILLPGCSETQSGDMLDVKDYPSPDGKYILTVYQMVFYNTTGYAREVYLRRKGEKLHFPGNVYTSDVWGDVEVSWTSPTNILLKLLHALPP